MSRLPSSSSDRAAAAPTFKDGLGTRVRAGDQGGDAVEHLQLAQEVAAQESALRDRVGRLINFRHARYVRLRGVDRAKTGTKPLVIAYDALDGHRLSTVLETLPKVSLSLEVDVALQIVRDLLPAIGILHDSRKVTHGCIAPERLVYTAQQRLVIVDHGLGAAMQRLNLPRKKLWDQYRIASPAPSKALFDEKMDVVQIGLVALALLIGRPLTDDEYPAQVKRLILGVKENSSRIGSRPIGPELRRWLERATGVDEAQTFASIKEAQDAFETVVSVDRYSPAAGLVKTFFTRYEEAAARIRPEAVEDDEPAKPMPGAKVDVDSALAGLDMQVTITPTRRRPAEPLPEAIELKPPSKAKSSKSEAPAEPAKAETSEPVKFGRRKTDRLDAMQALQEEMGHEGGGDVSALEDTANAVYKDAERRGRAAGDEKAREAREAAERARQEAEAREKTEREGRTLAEKVARDAAEQAARESADRVAAERQAQAAAEREAAERGARQEAEKLARDASAREEAERGARQRLERDHQEAAERRAREQAERDAREAAERQAREQAEREARAAAERAAKEAAERAAAERAALEAALRAEREANERAAAERVAQEASHRAEREAAEREAAQRSAREHAERAEREAAQREAAQRAAQEHAERAEREAAQREAAQQAAREHAERAEREAAEREAAQRAAREAAEREAAHRAAREAAEQAAREAAERAVIAAAEREAEHRAALEAAEQAVREAAERAAAERAAREAAEQAAREASERAFADFAAQQTGLGEAEIASRIAAERQAAAREHAEAAESERNARALAEREAREMSERAKREAADRAAAERSAREAAARAEADREARAAAEREAQRAAERAERHAAERHAAEKAAREAAALMEAERQARAAAEARANEASEQAAREAEGREAAERAAREAAQNEGGRRRRKKRLGQRSADEVVAVQPLPSMAEVPDGPNFSTQPAPVEAPQAPMVAWQPGQSVEVMPAWARGGTGSVPAEPIAPEPMESAVTDNIYAPTPPPEPSHASILSFKPQDDSWMRRAPQPIEPAADAESRAVAPGPTTAPRKRFRINWARTLAASLLVALLEGVAFAAAWWYVTPEQQGWLVVHTKPAGIQVSVDGLVVGQTPVAKALPPGRHTIELRYGTATRVVPVEISAGVQTEQRLSWGNGFSTGQAQITSTPAGSKVSIDGRPMGKTPLTVSDLLPGKHEVTVDSDSGSVSAMLMVEAGETTELEVPVYAGWVSVLSPVELEILLDGKLIGSTEIEKLMLKPGRHKLDLENESLGYRGSVEVRVRPGATTSVSVVPKAPVTVEAPAGTELSVNGENMGTLPNASLEVPLGTAEFVMRYKDEERRQVVPITMSAPMVVKYDHAAPVDKR